MTINLTTANISNTPDNTSILQSTKFTFVIPEMPYLKYFCQTIQLPSVSMNEIKVPTPFTDTYRHGDKLYFQPFTITALMDEDLRVWEETYAWMEGLARPESYDQYLRKSKNDKTPLYYDAYLSINTNANRPNIRVKFYNCHPTSIGMVNFDTKVNADVIPTADITFRYDLFHIERIDV